jgi:hypothetical protein
LPLQACQGRRSLRCTHLPENRTLKIY